MNKQTAGPLLLKRSFFYRRAAVFLLIAAVFFNTACFAQETPPADIAAPTLENTGESVSVNDIVPDDIPTLEDFAPPFADEEDEGPYRFSIWRVVGSLALIVFLIVGVVYGMRFILARGMRYDLKGSHIRVLDVIRLGTNRDLYLVAVGGKIMLLGSTDKGLTYLSEISGGGDFENMLGEFSEEGGVDFQENLEKAVDNTQGPVPAGSAGPSVFMEKVKEKLKKLEVDKKRD